MSAGKFPQRIEVLALTRKCRMLLEVFRQMAERSAIDEQRNEWIQAPVVSGNQEGSDFDESDYGDSD